MPSAFVSPSWSPMDSLPSWTDDLAAVDKETALELARFMAAYEVCARQAAQLAGSPLEAQGQAQLQQLTSTTALNLADAEEKLTQWRQQLRDFNHAAATLLEHRAALMGLASHAQTAALSLHSAVEPHRQQVLAKAASCEGVENLLPLQEKLLQLQRAEGVCQMLAEHCTREQSSAGPMYSALSSSLHSRRQNLTQLEGLLNQALGQAAETALSRPSSLPRPVSPVFPAASPSLLARWGASWRRPPKIPPELNQIWDNAQWKKALSLVRAGVPLTSEIPPSKIGEKPKMLGVQFLHALLFGKGVASVPQVRQIPPQQWAQMFQNPAMESALGFFYQHILYISAPHIPSLGYILSDPAALPYRRKLGQVLIQKTSGGLGNDLPSGLDSGARDGAIQELFALAAPHLSEQDVLSCAHPTPSMHNLWRILVSTPALPPRLRQCWVLRQAQFSAGSVVYQQILRQVLRDAPADFGAALFRALPPKHIADVEGVVQDFAAAANSWNEERIRLQAMATPGVLMHLVKGGSEEHRRDLEMLVAAPGMVVWDEVVELCVQSRINPLTELRINSEASGAATHLSSAAHLVSHLAPLVNLPSQRQQLPVVEAALRKDWNTVELLVRAGAHGAAPDGQGRSLVSLVAPLQEPYWSLEKKALLSRWSSEQESFPLAQILKASALPELEFLSQWAQALGKQGSTAMAVACLQNSDLQFSPRLIEAALSLQEKLDTPASRILQSYLLVSGHAPSALTVARASDEVLRAADKKALEDQAAARERKLRQDLSSAQSATRRAKRRGR